MTRWLHTCLASALALGLALSRPSHAEPVPPTEADRAVLVSTPQGPEILHLLRGGESLSFATRGPGELEVVARRRLPSPTITPPPIPVLLLGDGQTFLTLQVGQPADSQAKVNDAVGGTISAPDRARVEVPAGAERLTLRSAAGAPDVFVRVERR